MKTPLASGQVGTFTPSFMRVNYRFSSLPRLKHKSNCHLLRQATGDDNEKRTCKHKSSPCLTLFKETGQHLKKVTKIAKVRQALTAYTTQFTILPCLRKKLPLPCRVFFCNVQPLNAKCASASCLLKPAKLRGKYHGDSASFQTFMGRNL